MDYLIISDKLEISKRLLDKFTKVLLESNEFKSRGDLNIETKDGDLYKFTCKSKAELDKRGFRGKILSDTIFSHMIDTYNKSRS